MERNTAAVQRVPEAQVAQGDIEIGAGGQSIEREKLEKQKDRIFGQWLKLPPEERAVTMLAFLRHTIRNKQRGEGETYDFFIKFVNEILPPDLKDMLP